MHGSLTVREITLLQASECFNRVTVKRNLSAEPQSLTHTVLHVLMVEQSRADGSGNVCACTRVCVCVCIIFPLNVEIQTLLCSLPFCSVSPLGCPWQSTQIHSDCAQILVQGVRRDLNSRHGRHPFLIFLYRTSGCRGRPQSHPGWFVWTSL